MVNLMRSKLPDWFLGHLWGVEAALRNRAKHDVLNRPVKALNRKVKESNRGMTRDDPNWTPLHKLKYPYTKRIKRIFKKEADNRNERLAKTAEEWQEEIDLIAWRDMRNYVGSIIWWDHFGPNTEVDKSFHKYIMNRIKVLPKPWETAIQLVELGYTPYTAYNRAKPPVVSHNPREKLPPCVL